MNTKKYFKDFKMNWRNFHSKMVVELSRHLDKKTGKVNRPLSFFIEKVYSNKQCEVLKKIASWNKLIPSFEEKRGEWSLPHPVRWEEAVATLYYQDLHPELDLYKDKPSFCSQQLGTETWFELEELFGCLGIRTGSKVCNCGGSHSWLGG